MPRHRRVIVVNLCGRSTESSLLAALVTRAAGGARLQGDWSAGYRRRCCRDVTSPLQLQLRSGDDDDGGDGGPCSSNSVVVVVLMAEMVVVVVVMVVEVVRAAQTP